MYTIYPPFLNLGYDFSCYEYFYYYALKAYFTLVFTSSRIRIRIVHNIYNQVKIINNKKLTFTKNSKSENINCITSFVLFEAIK